MLAWLRQRARPVPDRWCGVRLEGLLLVPYPARGHVAPFLRLGMELAQRRIPVRMIVAPHHIPAVAATGVVPVPAGSEAGAHVPPGWRLPDLMARRAAAARRRQTVREVSAAFDREVTAFPPAAVLVDPHARWLRNLPGSVQRVWLWTTSSSASRSAAPALLNGLSALTGPSRPGCVQPRFVGPMHGGLPVPGADFPYHRLTGGALLVVSFGTVFERRPGVLRRIAWSFRGTPWEVVLSAGRTDLAELGPMPDNVIVAADIPQEKLLRRASVLLTHGGMNSVLEAAAAGVPMLFAPRSGEQRRTARRVAELGAGALLEPGVSLVRQVERAWRDERIADGARRLRGLVDAAPSIAEAADVLVELAGLASVC